ncbi:MAG: arginine decarboxylase [Candidatus Promineifilaceae bacterium]
MAAVETGQKAAVIGWESSEPVPNGTWFNDYLHVVDGRLQMDGVDLAQLLHDYGADQGLGGVLPSPLEIVYMPLIRRQIARMRHWFARAIDESGYAGQFLYAYASKANAAEEVVRTTLGVGAHHEMSSTIDVDIARLMIQRGLIQPQQLLICNGFKPPASAYMNNILSMRREHEQIIPVLEDLDELAPLLNAGVAFDVGLRQKTYGHNRTFEEMEAVNSRFGLNSEAIWKTAAYIDASPNLRLRLYHAMVGSQMPDAENFVSYLHPGIEMYARLRDRYPTLEIFDFGGGMPAAMTLDFEFDYLGFARELLAALQEACDRYHVPVPHIMGEFGRFTTAAHGAHLFSVATSKDNGSDLPWYLINGSIMTSFPDSWALGEHFICLPLNNLDGPFQEVQLGGMTCDSDDVYPPKKSHSHLFLPIDTENLTIGFFGIGAYQEMLGGVRGSKHCVLPEANELLIDRDEEGALFFEVLRGQNAHDVLRNLGYRPVDM